MSAQVTEAHKALVYRIRANMEPVGHYEDAETCAKLIADSEARAVEAVASTRDTYQREAYHLRKDLCEIAAAFNVGVPDGEEAKKRIIAVKAERDQLRAEVERLNRVINEFIACENGTDWKARAERAEAEVERLKRRDSFDLQAINKIVADQTKNSQARAEKAEAEVERLDREKPWLAEFKQIATEQRERAERAEAELAKERARLDWLEKFGATPICSRAAIDAAMKEEAT